MEKWDLYDKNRKKLNKVVLRGEKLKKNEFHLVVNGWIKNEKNEFLITQRAPNNSFAYMWECTGGSAQSGETSLDAIAREIKEELNIKIDKTKARLFNSALRFFKDCPDILDVWIILDNTPIEKIKIQKDEVMNVKWATKQEILDLYNQGKFEANIFFEEVLNSL